jgi:hypothetical protein
MPDHRSEEIFEIIRSSRTSGKSHLSGVQRRRRPPGRSKRCRSRRRTDRAAHRGLSSKVGSFSTWPRSSPCRVVLSVAVEGKLKNRRSCVKRKMSVHRHAHENGAGPCVGDVIACSFYLPGGAGERRRQIARLIGSAGSDGASMASSLRISPDVKSAIEARRKVARDSVVRQA